MISVLTPTVRPDGLQVIRDSLRQQTLKDFEWIICSPDNNAILQLLIDESQQTNPINIKWVKDKGEGGYWTLNRAYNDLFRTAKGDIIVTWQDWIWAPADALQKFVDAIDATGGGIISGVGDQYERVGKFGKPEIKIWSDPRKNLLNGSFYECYPNDCEWNFAAFPKEYIFEIGGMDEELDFLGFGGDQLQVGERWDSLGKKFYLDQDNESYTIRHNRDSAGGQENWDKNHVLFNGKYEQRKRQLVASGAWPRLNYLFQDNQHDMVTESGGDLSMEENTVETPVEETVVEETPTVEETPVEETETTEEVETEEEETSEEGEEA